MKSEKVKSNKAKTPKGKGIPENLPVKDCCHLKDCGRLVRLASFLAVLSSLREMGFLKSETILSDEFQKDLIQKFNDRIEYCFDDAYCVIFGKDER